MAAKAFFYGTLMHPKILKRVIENDGSHLQICPAVLLEHTRHKVKWRQYPGILPYAQGSLLLKTELKLEERSVRGTLVTGLTKEDMELLDEFEGTEYTRQRVSIYPLGGLVALSVYDGGGDELPFPSRQTAMDAETYIYNDSGGLKPEPWSYEEFLRENAWKCSIIFLFVVFFFAYGLCNEIAAQGPLSPNRRFPDFAEYQALRTLSAEDFPLDQPGRRVLIVGDIHGMHKPFIHLLEKASYDSDSDVLIHVGDVVTKSSHKQSMKMLAYLASNNITGVRGNHDQTVVEWRSWINWINSLPGGQRWLKTIYLKWREERRRGSTLDQWLNQEKLQDRSHWWKKLPKGWKLFSDHFNIAHDMTDAQYHYLRSLPLRIFVPSAHVFIVHAGLLPSDPVYPHNHPRQPLAHIPQLPLKHTNLLPNETYPFLRRIQEISILNDIPQNTVPWNVLNMRTIRKGKISKNTHGKKWMNAWNHDMSLCRGFDIDGAVKGSLSCYPSTVVYGHTASWGLDVERWSIGLDTGCVYGRKLTALVLGPSTSKNLDHDDVHAVDDHSILFGESGHGKLLSVSCS